MQKNRKNKSAPISRPGHTIISFLKTIFPHNLKFISRYVLYCSDSTSVANHICISKHFNVGLMQYTVFTQNTQFEVVVAFVGIGDVYV